ncbi:AzlD domain-containing protein [Enterovibrio sp. ZSDZ35]|uniref:AzlD domain-containing protein n=1 Tax=Enterovibrio qingdaonensis TaxID=2899818 RepID=A0ABT5QQP5_9GAMM|nr:AzlD domain-containing protein [Enterovibrio sp. ZSDZ35]MDD1783199.1 AzlD domain-containing protein [Enterovibrio sp. ZSDZ35]
MHNWLMIIGMAAITFSVRYFFLAKSIPFRVSPTLQRFLKFSAPAVLTALAVPILVFPDGHLDVSFDNAFLLAGSFVCLLSVIRLGTLPTVVISMGFFLLIQ